jgi:glucose-6-phosphate isomerase
VISKSGETAETAAQFILFRDLLQQKLGKKYAENILATTDPKGGTLREICTKPKAIARWKCPKASAGGSRC